MVYITEARMLQLNRDIKQSRMDHNEGNKTNHSMARYFNITQVIGDRLADTESEIVKELQLVTGVLFPGTFPFHK
jgi:hypothetical protein